ncbi:MAG: hypothetical protein AABW73_01730 [Nanoarchaeota archaeon]
MSGHTPKKVRIYVDAIGGDTITGKDGKEQKIEERVVRASLEFLDEHKEARIILGGDRKLLEGMVDGSDRIEVVDGRATPYGISAIRRERKGTALYKGLEMLEAGDCDGLYTSGNTQAVAVYVATTIGRFKGIKSMPLVARLPKKGEKPVYLLDVGGGTDNLDVNGFRDLALLAHAYCKAVAKVDNPRLGLLSIGKEPEKGGPTITEVDKKLRETRCINYSGLVEPKDWMMKEYEAVISNGFVGNIGIKTIGGTVILAKSEIKEALNKYPVRKFLAKAILAPAAAMILGPVFYPLKEKYNPSRANGAALLVPGVFIKGHGESDVEGIRRGLGAVSEHVNKEVPRRMKEELKMVREQLTITE